MPLKGLLIGNCAASPKAHAQLGFNF
jgi:hypothetical protein